MKKKYTMRNELVLLRKVVQSKVGSVLVPEKSMEGTRFLVEEIGPAVRELEVGNEVMIMGKAEDPFYPVPGEPALIIVRQDQIAYVVQRLED